MILNDRSVIFIINLWSNSMPRIMDIKEHVRKLRQFLEKEGHFPSYGQMLSLFNYNSKNAVFGVINKLHEHGFVTKRKGRVIPTARLKGCVRVLGSVQAGFPSPAEEELVDTITIDEYLIQRPEATYMLTIKGDSMIEAGIVTGDIILVERGGTPKSGDIVVAQVDDEWTVKYYIKDTTGVRLDAANAKYKSIRPKRSLVIGGIVKAVIRKY